MNKKGIEDWVKGFITLLVFFVFIGVIIYVATRPSDMQKCQDSIKGKEGLYCFKQQLTGCNLSNPNYLRYGCDPDTYRYDIRNKTAEDLQAQAELNAQQKAKECYDSGQWYNYSFNIMQDYNLSCKKLAYINDHLIDKSRQLDGGYISGDYSGLLSDGHIEGHLYQYVTEGVLATGQLIKNISYHLDCQNSTLTVDCPNDYWYGGNGIKMCRTDTKSISYYSESDFVMYYTNRCIQ